MRFFKTNLTKIGWRERLLNIINFEDFPLEFNEKEDIKGMDTAFSVP